MVRRRTLATLTGLAIAASAGSSADPAFGRELILGFGDPAFRTADRDPALDRAQTANAQVVRIAADWRTAAPERPSNPANPADPAYRFAALDETIRAAATRGLGILLEVGRAPSWAEGSNRPSTTVAPPGTWRPDATAYGQFARAVATRYSGQFSPGIGQPPLPEVRNFQAGNEPNLSTYLTPQWSGNQMEAARVYRDMLTAFYDGIKTASPGAVVVSAGTAPYGEDPGGRRTRPVAFLRELFCLNENATGCAAPVPLDVLAHHPINAYRPFRSADHPEDATTPDIGRVRAVLQEAAKSGRIRSAGTPPIWVTEFWWESDPPDRAYGVPLRKHARFTAEALYLFWKQRVQVVMGLQLADSPIDPQKPGDSFQTGLYFDDGRPKATLDAFRFPFVAVKKKRRILAWTRSPADGALKIQGRVKGGWRTIRRGRASAAKVFTAKLRAGSPRKLRAKLGQETSFPYRARRR